MSDSECSLPDSRLLPCGHLLAAPGARGQDHVTHQLDGALSTETITLQGAQPLRKSPGPPAPKQNQVWLSESSLQLPGGLVPHVHEPPHRGLWGCRNRLDFWNPRMTYGFKYWHLFTRPVLLTQSKISFCCILNLIFFYFSCLQ